jgi:hypothetical protein
MDADDEMESEDEGRVEEAPTELVVDDCGVKVARDVEEDIAGVVDEAVVVVCETVQLTSQYLYFASALFDLT